MKFFAHNDYSRKHFMAMRFGSAALLALQIGGAFAADVPPGFRRLANGEIVVADPAKAFAPVGYRISEGGVLLKEIDDPVADTLRAMERVDARAAETNSGSASGGVSQKTEQGKPPVEIATTPAVAEAEPPPGFHRMADGTFMATQRGTAVAPPGYRLMPDGTLMPGGNAVDHSQHSQGGGMWMLDYKFEHMYMNGMLDTTKSLSAADVMSAPYGFSMSPTDMTMDMHMLMLMVHGDQFMAMIMGHFMSNEMGMIAGDGTESTMKTSGLGDTIISAVFPGPHKLSFTVGVSLPTGSIDERGPMTHSAAYTEADAKYPYSMQLGSGSTDLIQGIGYENAAGAFAWGGALEYKGRFQKNSNGYKLGDQLLIDGWMRWDFMESYSATGKMRWTSIGQIEGADKALDAMMSPDMDASASGGRRLDLGFVLKNDLGAMSYVSLEFAVPVYQNLWGPQMKTEWMLGLGAGTMF